jgi:hypothetical protein
MSSLFPEWKRMDKDEGCLNAGVDGWCSDSDKIRIQLSGCYNGTQSGTYPTKMKDVGMRMPGVSVSDPDLIGQLIRIRIGN